MTRLGGLTVLLAGCGPSLAGEWVGDLDCDTLVFELSVDLDKAGKNLFAGPLGFHFEDLADNGATLVVDLDWDTQLRIDGSGAQPIDFEAVYTDATCAAYRSDGSLISDDCSTLGLDTSVFENADQDLEATWDGADAISFTQEGCTGSLTRQ